MSIFTFRYLDTSCSEWNFELDQGLECPAIAKLNWYSHLWKGQSSWSHQDDGGTKGVEKIIKIRSWNSTLENLGYVSDMFPMCSWGSFRARFFYVIPRCVFDIQRSEIGPRWRWKVTKSKKFPKTNCYWSISAAGQFRSGPWWKKVGRMDRGRVKRTPSRSKNGVWPSPRNFYMWSMVTLRSVL